MDGYLHFPVTVVEGDKVPAPAGKETNGIRPYAVVVLKNLQVAVATPA